MVHDNGQTRVAFTSEEEVAEKKKRASSAPKSGDAPKKESKPRKSTKKAEAAPAEPAYKYTLATLPKVCPVCGVGQILRGKTAFGCSNYANGCTFRIPFEEVKPE